MSGDRPARLGDLCTCGRQAKVVYTSEQWGQTGACLIDDGGRGGRWPCVFCHGAKTHPRGERCPLYQLRPTPAD